MEGTGGTIWFREENEIIGYLTESARFLLFWNRALVLEENIFSRIIDKQ